MGDRTAQLATEEKLSTIIQASERLLKTLKREDTITAVLELCPDLIQADGCAVWRHDDASGQWSISKSSGLSDRYVAAIVDRVNSTTGKKNNLTKTVLVDDVSQASWFADTADLYRDEGIVSLLITPLEFYERSLGTITFYLRAPRKFAESDIQIASAIANLAACAISSAELYEARLDMWNRETAERRRSAFLAETSMVLGTSLDYKQTLESVANRAVPEIADWCVVDLLNDEGAIEAVAIAHVDPQKIELAREFRRRFPPDLGTTDAYTTALKTGRSQLVPVIRPEMLENIPDREVRDFLQSLSLSSTMIVPIQVRNKILGTITFIQSESGRHYSEADKILAEDLTRRAALSIDNALLYDQAHSALAAREAALAKLQKQISRQAVLTTVSQRNLSRIDLPTSLTDTIFWLINAFKIEHCAVLEWSAFDPRFVVKAVAGWGTNELAPYLANAATYQFLHEIIVSDMPFFFENAAGDDRISHLELLKTYRLASGILTPIKTSESTFGLVGVFSRKEMAFSQDDIQFLQSIVNVVAASIERLEAERSLQTSEQKYRQLFDLSPDGIVVCDRDYRITTTNPEAIRIFGFNNPLEMVGCELRKLVAPGDLRKARSLVDLTAKSGNVRDFEIILRRRDGSLFPAEISAEAIRDNHDTPIAFFGIIHDITQRKELEEMKNDFIATVSHELRTPLTSIYVSLDLVARGRIPLSSPEAGPMIDVAHKNCLRLIHLINDFLDLQKIEFGSPTFEVQEMNLFDLIDQAVVMNQAYAEQYGVRYVVSGHPSDIRIMVHPDRFLQVLTNLLSNAAKFSPTDQNVILSVTYQKAQARVSVTNYGPPIPEKFREKLFNKFVQVNGSLQRKRDGTGLGLAISKGIVEKMGGHIDFRSDAAETTFFLDFPAKVIRAVAVPTAGQRFSPRPKLKKT